MTTKKTKNKKSPLLSLAIVRESVRSNWISFLVTAIGNVLIAIVVILILSTLGLNTLQDSLSQLFSNADMLSLVGQGSISYYLAYSNAVELDKGSGPFVTDFKDEFTTLVPVGFQTQETLEESPLLQGLVKTMFFNPYYENYQNAEGTDEEKHQEAKSLAMNEDLLNTIKSLIPDLAFLSNESIETFLSCVLDSYHEEMLQNPESFPDDADVPSIIEGGMNLSIRSILSRFGASEEKISAFLVEFEKARTIDKESGTITDEQLLNLYYQGISSIAPNGMEKELVDFAKALIASKESNPDAYENNTVLEGQEFGYRDEALFAAIEDLLSSMMGQFAYLSKLPDFTVYYLTDDLGRPIAREEGKEVVLTSYDPERMIPVANGMYVSANILQKQHKYELTGTDYTEEEIQTAKEESQEEIRQLIGDVDSFLRDMVRQENAGKDPGYYTPAESGAMGEVHGEKLVPVILDVLKRQAQEQILEAFDVSSLDEIGKDKQGVSGTQLLEFVQNQCVGAIYSYETYLGDNTTVGASAIEAMMSSMAKASQSILDNLPASVEKSFLELSEMNMYGIFIGIMFFGLAGLLLPMVFTILTANELVAQKVENGSMAFTLSAPVRRRTVLFSKAFSLLLAMVLMSLLLLCGSLVARAIGIAVGGKDFQSALPIGMLLRFVLGNFLCMFSISGICFLSSSCFSKTKYALGIGGGITIFFLVCAILGLFGGPAMPSTIRIEAMDFFNYLTILSFYDASSAMANSPVFYYKLIALLGIGILTYLSSFLVFEKKDLPL